MMLACHCACNKQALSATPSFDIPFAHHQGWNLRFRWGLKVGKITAIAADDEAE